MYEVNQEKETSLNERLVPNEVNKKLKLVIGLHNRVTLHESNNRISSFSMNQIQSGCKFSSTGFSALHLLR